MSDQKLLVATRKGLFTFEPAAGDHWRITSTAFLGDPVVNALVDRRDGTWYATLNHGHFGVKLHRSDDAGQSWSECGLPVYPAKPDDEAAREAAHGTSNPWSLKQIWIMETGGPDEPGTLWAGTIPGGLFVSRDRAASWQLVESLWNVPERLRWFGGGYDHPGIHSIAVDPRDSRRLIVGISCGGVWSTDDGGQSWQVRTQGMYAEFMPPELREDPAIQDPHRVVRCPGSPDRLWASHHNACFSSTDEGLHWDEITSIRPSKFGFVVAAHPHNPDTAWYVPAIKDERRIPVDGRLVVSRTRDGGRTFDVLGEGLPQEHAYHLVYRHSLDVDPSGDHLAMGSTTGGLWTSPNQGDRWQHVTSDLPPIYAVRFQ